MPGILGAVWVWLGSWGVDVVGGWPATLPGREGRKSASPSFSNSSFRKVLVYTRP